MRQGTDDPTVFDNFARSLDRADVIDWLRSGLIGEGAMVPGPMGPQPMLYADYVASGRALQQVEDVVSGELLAYYANSHTEASYCGQMMTRLRRQARQIIMNSCNADDRFAVVFTGSGATAGLNRVAKLMLARKSDPAPLVILGPYEHHSNILPWRESGAETVELSEDALGGPDLHQLEDLLKANAGRHVVCSFSAMSNVTGIVTDVQKVTRLVKRHGALCVWDYAGGAPYMQIDMGAGTDAQIDAVVLSPHKFIGGPGASGVLILRRDCVDTCAPTLPGGGTVSFVSPWEHDYSTDVVAREEAGTPNVIGDLRAALCFMVKDAIGQDEMTARLTALRDRAFAGWAATPGLTMLGNPNATRLPIFSFYLQDSSGQRIHQQLVTRILSDHFGIQARGGCACAGPYAHRLLDIDRAQSEQFRQAILQGREIEKPGWTRLGLSVLMTDEKVDRIIDAVNAIAQAPHRYIDSYLVDESTARFSPKQQTYAAM